MSSQSHKTWEHICSGYFHILRLVYLINWHFAFRVNPPCNHRKPQKNLWRPRWDCMEKWSTKWKQLIKRWEVNQIQNLPPIVNEENTDRIFCRDKQHYLNSRNLNSDVSVHIGSEYRDRTQLFFGISTGYFADADISAYCNRSVLRMTPNYFSQYHSESVVYANQIYPPFLSNTILYTV